MDNDLILFVAGKPGMTSGEITAACGDPSSRAVHGRLMTLQKSGHIYAVPTKLGKWHTFLWYPGPGPDYRPPPLVPRANHTLKATQKRVPQGEWVIDHEIGPTSVFSLKTLAGDGNA